MLPFSAPLECFLPCPGEADLSPSGPSVHEGLLMREDNDLRAPGCPALSWRKTWGQFQHCSCRVGRNRLFLVPRAGCHGEMALMGTDPTDTAGEESGRVPSTEDSGAAPFQTQPPNYSNIQSTWQGRAL